MIALIRIPVLGLCFIIVNIIFLLACIVRPFHRNNVQLGSRLYSSLSVILGLKLDIRVPESVRSGGPFVYIGNHQNTFDIFTICGATQAGTVSVGKKSLVWIPIFGWVYWLSGNILIDRTNTNRASNTLKLAARKIRERRLSVWIFPEGTRSNGKGLLPFKTGAFRLAKLTNEPVVMICASSLHNKVKWNRWNNGTLIIEMSEPVVMDESLDLKGWTKYFHQQMSENIQRIDAEVAQLDKAG
ncbi:1-acylglycerol-3-phosphate O-acyltransferase [Bowmanella sp. JS7-9]|uniref:1-acyl-sn-glycerol-3-phosphate acyltransferase n=1 Tax=Pseudobowmanella zhangzhouensis TaxID=1537679 RepID=A0ABW1XMQ5_9ALTE|nr:1-acylglycerol-3-phosphate O-acyltransferase [Bowmanella sp. JS7-9]TBX21882.1 acyl-phosphate glycerol 3-phosphate acyltransferase [Bowmanella sp. JS7-9]